LNQYESFTCVAGDGKVRGKETAIDRDSAGAIRYTWKAGADRLDPGKARRLIAAAKLRESETCFQLGDIESGAAVQAGRGSVFWNQFTRRWIMITSGEPGDVWFSQADTPAGPWIYARRIARHGRYNFYNPTQHPFFDQEGGRVIYFEGTYTDSFSGAPAKTPRYDYNQIMYRLKLDDPRLALPAPVYRVRQESGRAAYLMREGVAAKRAWDSIESTAFYAVPPQLRHEGLIPIYVTDDGSALRATGAKPDSIPAFYAMPSTAPGTGEPPLASALTGPLQDENGKPLAQIWKNRATGRLEDFHADAAEEVRGKP
jgi:hypothetical protein